MAMLELGFEIIGRKGGESVFESEFSEVFVSDSGKMEYSPKGLQKLDSEDVFRIGKIVEAYQKLPEIVETGEKRSGEIRALVSRYESALGKKIPPEKRELYEKIVFLSTGEGVMPLEPLLKDPLIEEIMVNGTSSPIFVYHRKFGMLPTNLRFTSSEYLVEKANQLLFPMGKRVDRSKPSAHAILPSGERVSVEIPPVSKEPSIAIRKFSENPLTITDLVGLGMLDFDSAAFLSLAIAAGASNIGVIGNTGAGKTTLLNALLRFVPERQRIAVVEEIPEISVPHENKVCLSEAENLGIRMGFLVRETLRLRPDRIVIGEVRGPEDASALREACLSGPAYSTFYTYHADSPEGAVERLKSQGIGENDLGYFGILVSCRRFETKKEGLLRKVLEISEIDGKGKVRKIFGQSGKKGGLLKKTGVKSKAEERISREFLGGAPIGPELASRKSLLKKLAKLADREFFREFSEKTARETGGK